MTKYAKKEPKRKYPETYEQNTIATKEHQLRLGASKT